MNKYLFADIVVEFNNQYDFLPLHCKHFVYTGDRPVDISISITDEEIKEEQNCHDEIFDDGYLEYICAYRKLASELPKFDAFVLHSAVIKVEDKGIAFLASSGTGKTTHLLFWHEICGKKLKVINGDKPIVRFFDGVPYAYGTPWAGKEGYYSNDRVVLTDLCFIERATENEVISLQGLPAAMLLLNQIYRPNDASILDSTYSLADKLLKSCNLRKIRCTKHVSAAKTAYKAIFR